MQHLIFWNNGRTTLADPITDVATTINLVDGNALSGSGMSDAVGASQLLTISHPSNPDVYEIVLAVGVVPGSETNSRIIQRGVWGPDSTGPLAWAAGSVVSARVTAGMLNSFVQDRRLQKQPAILRDENPGGFLGPGSTTTPVIIYTHSVDLGTPPTWAASTIYAHGDIVIPTTPNGHQYRMCARSGLPESGTSSGTEPTWGTETELIDGTARWLRSSLTTGVSLRLDTGMEQPDIRMFVDEVGFISRTVTASGVPSVSIGSAFGVSPNPVLFADAVSLAQITADQRIHRIASTVSSSVEGVAFKSTTAASGGRCVGQFYARGLCVQDGLVPT